MASRTSAVSIKQNAANDRFAEEGEPRPEVQSHEQFLRSLYLEQRRSERSGRRFVLMLLESGELVADIREVGAVEQVLAALQSTIRETDTIGWQDEDSVIGVIFTEIGEVDGKAVANALLSKVSKALSKTLSIEQINQVRISFHIFPEDWKDKGGNGTHRPELFPDLMPGEEPRKGLLAMKRLVDITGSLLAIAAFSPLLIGTAIAVKLTSPGPVFFRQRRVGQYGKTFTFLKFRSMKVNNDASIHQQYVKRLIEGKVDGEEQGGNGKVFFKLANDPRLTKIGGFLRRSSFDELPQFFNVLKGDMSIVGPRPPIPYEVEAYSPWHRRRLLSVKPGITGLWQVTGRSRVTFDEMVRLDLRYARTWTPWMDLKIIFMTPRAVLGGSGAC